MTNIPETMQSWQLNKYGEIKDLQFSDTATIPLIKSKTDILIQVKASSVNPIDVEMLGGFGQALTRTFQKLQNLFSSRGLTEFPATYGRDFSGIVVATGKSVHNFKPGDEVWGVVPLYLPGTHAEYVVAPANCVALKPTNLDHVQAAALPYVCVTSLAALTDAAGLVSPRLDNKRVLILGGSGGIGTFAVQWLKAKGAYVATTVSPDAIPLMEKLGADTIISYRDPNCDQLLMELDPFNVILNSVGHSASVSNNIKSLLSRSSNCQYLTLSSPLLKNMDDRGLFRGNASSFKELSCQKFTAWREGYKYDWAYAQFDAKYIKQITYLVESEMIVPVIEKIFKFQDLPEAFAHVKRGHSRGKTVIDMSPGERS